MMNKLDQLKSMTTVVADTGDIDAIAQFAPMDATTNPSLLLKASELPRYQALIEQSVTWAKQQSDDAQQQITDCADYLSVQAGLEILKVIPGRISTEVDARLSFDTQATIEKARKLIKLYADAGIPSDRVLIKIASTWEGISAAKQLEQEGIQCNLTLLFSFAQAKACADAGVYLISPFVGRILDWYKASTGQTYNAETDPGVISVARIYRYYKQHGYKTVVMGASFRNAGEIEQLAGCDRLTISPALMAELEQDEDQLSQMLDDSQGSDDPLCPPSEQVFRWEMNEDAMATEKLAEGIRNFTIDQVKLEEKLKQLLTSQNR
jgi:transaldolase